MMMKTMNCWYLVNVILIMLLFPDVVCLYAVVHGVFSDTPSLQVPKFSLGVFDV